MKVYTAQVNVPFGKLFWDIGFSVQTVSLFQECVCPSVLLQTARGPLHKHTRARARALTQSC